MEIQLNGTAFTTSAVTLMELVNDRGLDPATVIVEYNHGVIKQETWETTALRRGDTIELLSFVGGG